MLKIMKIGFTRARKDQIPPKFEGIGSHGPCPAPGHPQTSHIQFKIFKKHVFVKNVIL